MMKRFTKRLSNKFLFLGLPLLIGFALYGQNCSDIKLIPNLKPAENNPITSIPSQPKYLRIPTVHQNLMRVVLFVDFSRSMLTGPCPGHIDTMIPGVPASNCTTSVAGNDPQKHRLNLIRNWIDQLEAQVGPGVNPEKLKILIVPFSGGQSETYMSYPYRFPAVSHMSFSGISNARQMLDKLEDSHDSLLQSLASGGNSPTEMSQVLTVSIPAQKLQILRQMVQQEVNRLKNTVGANGETLASNTKFEIAFLSDGVPKPLPIHIVKAMEFIWQVNQCNDEGCGQRPGVGTCQQGGNFSHCANTCRTYINQYQQSAGQSVDLLQVPNEDCRVCFRNLIVTDRCDRFLDRYHLFWGDPYDNTMASIYWYLRDIKNIFVSNPEVQYNFNFILLNPDKIPDVEKDPEINWIIRSRELYASARHAEISSATPPFQLFATASQSNTFRLGKIFAINPHARINSAGILDIDSDGDGLFDYEEVQISSFAANPGNPRSNGYCLDLITYLNQGCITTNCDPLVDKDGDGLNECEEMTLGTSDEDFDTDGDGIPDGLEVIYGYNPLFPDTGLDSNADGYDNLTSFTAGLHPYAYLEDIPVSSRVSFSVNFHDYQAVVNPLGHTMHMAGYVTELHNMPITNTLQATDVPHMYFKQEKVPANRLQHRIIGGSHAAGINLTQYLARVDSVQSPGEFYWIWMQKPLDFNQGSQTIELNLEEMQYIQVLDPHVVGEP